KPCEDLSQYMSKIPFEVLAGDKHARDIPLNKEMLSKSCVSTI
ncbi:MAG: hypothetical protein QG588_702, partial [Candidatus Poribacteria bacterium]|nr:hypothetical protein [Candidatus Poribacteria bacterium]